MTCSRSFPGVKARLSDSWSSIFVLNIMPRTIAQKGVLTGVESGVGSWKPQRGERQGRLGPHSLKKSRHRGGEQTPRSSFRGTARRRLSARCPREPEAFSECHNSSGQKCSNQEAKSRWRTSRWRHFGNHARRFQHSAALLPRQAPWCLRDLSKLGHQALVSQTNTAPLTLSIFSKH